MLRAHALKPNSLQRGKIHSGIIVLEPSSFVVGQLCRLIKANKNAHKNLVILA
jgi:hypothetical protein